jgi:hypothetical protein
MSGELTFASRGRLLAHASDGDNVKTVPNYNKVQAIDYFLDV